MSTAEERKESYERKLNELSKRCRYCKQRSIERCNDCTIGNRIRWLETEYSDLTGWDHNSAATGWK